MIGFLLRRRALRWTLLLLPLPALALLGWWLLLSPERPGLIPLLTWLDRPLASEEEPRPFEVWPGETATEMALRLQKEGLLRNALLFRLLARTLETDRELEAGTYRLSPDMTARRILETLRRAEARYRSVTLLEGWRREEMALELERQGIVRAEEFLQATSAGGYQGAHLAYLPSGSSLEGYLFPDTYYLPLQPISAEEVVALMVQNFQRRALASLASRAQEQGLTVHEAVTLASIVEREAQVPEERALIAGVLQRRLREGMPLEADPTVQYSLVEAVLTPLRGYWRADLAPEDYAVDSPYNTYQVTGLPPGPICNPSLASLDAVLAPTPTDYLYFVARKDGSHAFATTLEEHLLNLRRYRP